MKKGFPGLVRVIEDKVENTPINVFEKLRENDILFIDSSHTVKTFGEVNYLFLEVIPRLKPGVLVHVHDIFLPFEYRPHHFLSNRVRQIWQEQYLLHAFLIFNNQFEVILGSSYLHATKRDILKELFPWYHHNRWPSSFWMRRRKGKR